MSEASILALHGGFVEASRLGDRLGQGALLKRLRDLFANVDPEKIDGFLDAVEKLIGLFGGGATVMEASAVSALSTSDLEAAGFGDNLDKWLPLIKRIITLLSLLG